MIDESLVSGVVNAAGKVVASGAISANGHGNVSLRAPAGHEMYFTTASTLNGLGAGRHRSDWDPRVPPGSRARRVNPTDDTPPSHHPLTSASCQIVRHRVSNG